MSKKLNKVPVSDVCVKDFSCDALQFEACTRTASFPERIPFKPLKGENDYFRTTIRIPRFIGDVVSEYSYLTNRSKNQLYGLLLFYALRHIQVQDNELVFQAIPRDVISDTTDGDKSA